MSLFLYYHIQTYNVYGIVAYVHILNWSNIRRHAYSAAVCVYFITCALNDMYDFLTSQKHRKGDHLVFVSLKKHKCNDIV